MFSKNRTPADSTNCQWVLIDKMIADNRQKRHAEAIKFTVPDAIDPQ
jgi:hypothetical protein